jgi:hypothetical protein
MESIPIRKNADAIPVQAAAAVVFSTPVQQVQARAILPHI